MNLLAHALLACSTLEDSSAEDSTGQECTGALMADYFTGQDILAYPLGIQTGIRQHRDIDDFTDHHPVFMEYRRSIAAAGAPRFTSGILADIFWDHVLASEWDNWGTPLCGQDLESFCDGVYARLGRTKDYHSPGFAKAYPWLVGMSWLSSYAGREGIERTLMGLAGRMSGAWVLEGCIRIMDELDTPMRQGFSEFWPELVEFAQEWDISRTAN
jgi:acyl carrier protein phosphodiesterase